MTLGITLLSNSIFDFLVCSHKYRTLINDLYSTIGLWPDLSKSFVGDDCLFQKHLSMDDRVAT